MPVISGGSSQSPSPRAFSTLKSEVARYVLLPSNPSALAACGDGINEAINRLNARRWFWNLTTQNLTLIASQVEYDLAAAFKAPRHCHLLDASGNMILSLDYFDPKMFEEVFQNRATGGYVEAYTVHNHLDDGYLTLSRTPDASYVGNYPTLRVRYFARTQRLTADSDVISVPAEVEPYVLWYAKMYAATIYDTGKAPFAQRAADDIWRLLIRDDTTSQISDWNEHY